MDMIKMAMVKFNTVLFYVMYSYSYKQRQVLSIKNISLSFTD